ncbi:hypothetical protein TWF506_005456 [Arthrobotrys conoides]|uniref:Clr5 domain-containing protein n=1 Tax=Arthrobotrys conoides TaxID=74498 RepID=A0AAN8NU58_9PEZI
MDLQWKPPQSIAAQTKKRTTKNLNEADVRIYKDIILQEVHSGTYKSVIETLKDVHQFEMSMDQLKKYLKIWGFQKKPRRGPRGRAELSHSTVVESASQSGSIASGNPFTGPPKGELQISYPPYSFAVTSFANTSSISSGAHERHSIESWGLYIHQDPSTSRINPQLEARDQINEPPLDQNVESLLNAVEKLQLHSSNDLADGDSARLNEDVRQTLPRLARSASSTRRLLENTTKITNSIDQSYFNEAFQDVGKLLNHLGGFSESGVVDGTAGLNLISTSSIRNLQREISTIAWTNRCTRRLVAHQRLKIGGSDVQISIDKRRYRSLTGEILEKVETNILFRWEDTSMVGLLNENEKVLCMRTVYQSMERYTPSLSISLGAYERMFFQYGADDILNAASTGDLEKIQGRCSKGQWSIRSCDQDGLSTLAYAIQGVFLNDDPVVRQNCMSIIKLVANEAPDDNARTTLYNEESYIDIDNYFIVEFLAFAGDPDLMLQRVTTGHPEKLRMLIPRLVTDTAEDLEMAYRCIHMLLATQWVISFDDLVELLAMTIDAIGDIYHSTAPRVRPYGQFCITAYLSGNHRQWNEALAKCRYQYTLLQAISWEARHSAVHVDEYYRYLEGAGDLRDQVQLNGYTIDVSRRLDPSEYKITAVSDDDSTNTVNPPLQSTDGPNNIMEQLISARHVSLAPRWEVETQFVSPQIPEDTEGTPIVRVFYN